MSTETKTPKRELLTRPVLPDRSAEKGLTSSNLEKPTLVAQKNTEERSSKLKMMILTAIDFKRQNGQKIDDDLLIRVLSRFDITAMNVIDRQELVGKLKEHNPTISTESILAAEKPPTLTKENKTDGNKEKEETTTWNGKALEIQENIEMKPDILIQFNNSLAGLGIKLDDKEFANLVTEVVLEKNNETNSELLKLKNTDLRGVIAMVKKSITEKLLQRNMFEVHQDYTSNPKEGKTAIDRYFESLKDFDKNNPNTEIYKKMMAESLKVGADLITFSKNLAGKLALRELFNR